MAAPDPVMLQRASALGIAVLNRPKALNSLSAEMIELLRRQYESWNHDATIQAILIKSAGGKAFCAGGDVKATVLEMRAGRPEIAKSFFRREYELNYYISTLQKPHIALIDGIIMGGGAGISIHGPFRIATERAFFAMPECGIGLFPDVGASHFLNRLPGALGTYLALTGARIKGFQLVEAGLATHFVPFSKIGVLESELQNLGDRVGNPIELESLFSSLQARDVTEPSGLLDDFPGINDCFRHDTVEGVLAALEGHKSEGWAEAALKQMATASPLSQKLCLQQMRLGRGASLAECLQMEFRLVSHIIDSPSDFEEGIRALLIDKDGKPHWNPPLLEKVSAERVNEMFKPIQPEDELQLTLPEAQLASRL